MPVRSPRRTRGAASSGELGRWSARRLTARQTSSARRSSEGMRASAGQAISPAKWARRGHPRRRWWVAKDDRNCFHCCREKPAPPRCWQYPCCTSAVRPRIRTATKTRQRTPHSRSVRDGADATLRKDQEGHRHRAHLAARESPLLSCLPASPESSCQPPFSRSGPADPSSGSRYAGTPIGAHPRTGRLEAAAAPASSKRLAVAVGATRCLTRVTVSGGNAGVVRCKGSARKLCASSETVLLDSGVSRHAKG